jgi:hypothetical protein
MKTKMTKLVLAVAGCLTLAFALTSTLVQAQTINILMLHGRTDPTSTTPNEQYGVFTTDQMGNWNGDVPNKSGAHVYYVQYDAWNSYFDSTTSGTGGWYWVNYAVNTYCNGANGQACYIICHSIGCAAFENWLAKSSYSTSKLVIHSVLAAESAAGGSELADSGVALIGESLGLNTDAPIDASITTSYTRGDYNHNNMQGVIVRGTGGTSNDTDTEVLTTCAYFPEQFTLSGNSDCTTCPLDIETSCDDSTVALHSTCGHNRVAAFENCNGYLPGTSQSDSAGTYEYHTYWVNDSGYKGPYSSQGKGYWNSSEFTWRVDHSLGKALVVDEWNAAPTALAP